MKKKIKAELTLLSGQWQLAQAKKLDFFFLPCNRHTFSKTTW